MEDKVVQPWLEKENWGKGEWDNEPDEYSFIYRGYHCIIVRNGLGALCGYVKIPKNSPFMKEELFSKIKVHGNIQFAEKDEYDDFWIGFDCCHYSDYVPVEETIKANYSDQLKQRVEDFIRDFGDPFRIKKTYKNIHFVTHEVMNMVDQIAKKRRITRRMKISKHKRKG